MKILINKTKRLLFVGKLMLKPGTNIVDDKFDAEEKTVKAWIKAKMLSVKDPSKMDGEAIEEAISTAYDNGVVAELKKLSEDKGVQEAAEEQSKENEKKQEELDEAIKAAQKESGKKDGKKA